MITKDALTQNKTIQKYYQFQSMIYDSTRWMFLFGRKEIIKLIAKGETPKNILEIGCGTGYNLKNLAKQFPDAKITGIDVSRDMLSRARKKLAPYKNVQLLEGAYGLEVELPSKPDLILFSYSLTMINPQWSGIISQACQDLEQGGKIAVTDFHSTNFNWFRSHMGNHHVRMDGHLDGPLRSNLETIQMSIKKGYFGVWNYFLFIGKKV